jgi:hypothetical protein
MPAAHYEVDDERCRQNSGLRFYKMQQTYRLSVFLHEQFNRLKDNINQTCQYFYESADVPNDL